MLLQPDGRVIVAGDFQSFDGVPRSGIARLHADPELRFTGLFPRPAGTLELTWITLPGRQYILQAPSDLQAWNSIQTNIATTFTQVFADRSPARGQRFYRILRGAP